MKTFRLLAVVVFFIIIGVDSYAAGNANRASTAASQIETKPKKADRDYDDKYAGYSMDGVASASQLAAQRSHTVSGKDERNFAIFTGITVVLIIFFFTQFKFFDK